MEVGFFTQPYNNPDSKVHGANMGPTWILSAPDGPHVCPMNLAIWEDANYSRQLQQEIKVAIGFRLEKLYLLNTLRPRQNG